MVCNSLAKKAKTISHCRFLQDIKSFRISVNASATNVPCLHQLLVRKPRSLRREPFMKRCLYTVIFCAVVAFCIPSVAQATPTGFTLTSGGNIVDSGYYVGPYTATITGGSSLQIICDNFNTSVHIGLSWTAVGNVFSNPNFLSAVKLAGSSTTGKSALQNYEAAAWLAEQIFANLGNATKVGDLQFALWAIFSSQAKNSPGFDNAAAAYYNTAINGVYTTAQFSNVTFWTPNPLSASQEYITVTPVPEPSSVLLLGIGLLCVGIVMRRKVGSQFAVALR